MKKQTKESKKIMNVIMSALGKVGVKKKNNKIRRRARRLAKQAAKAVK
jgi:hypothetical protein